MSKQITRVVKYHPLERHWYRVADYVQSIWHGFTSAHAGRIATWLLLRAMWITWHVVRLLLKLTLYVLVASCVVGCAVMYSGLMFCLGQGKVAKSLGS